MNGPPGQNGATGNGYTCMCMPPWSGINCDQQSPQQQQQQPPFNANNNQNQNNRNAAAGPNFLGMQKYFLKILLFQE